MKNCFVYCRKSSEDQCRQVQSIRDQKPLMQSLALQKGLNIKRVFVDEKSAGVPYQREAFQEMMNGINKGEASVIVTWKIDRLSRNPVENGQISWLLQQGVIEEIVTTDRNYLPTDNVLPLLVEGAMANQYIRDLSVNVKRGQQSKLDRGIYPACAPLGYKNVGKYKGEKTIIKDPEVCGNLQILWDLLKTQQYQLADLQRLMQSDYPLYSKKSKLIANSHFYRLFKDKFYCGVFTWGGKEYPASHETYLTQSEFDEIQAFLNRKEKTRERELDFDYKRVFTCATCQSVITAERKSKFNKSLQKEKAYTYYRCPHHRREFKCTEKPINEDLIEKQLLQELGKVSLPTEVIDFAIKMMDKQDDSITEAQSNGIKTIESAIKTTEAEIAKLKNTLITEEDLEIRELMKERYHQLKIKAQKLKEDKERLIQQAEQRNQNIKDQLSILKEAENILKNGSKSLKQKVVYSLGSNWQLKDKKLLYKPHFVCQAIIKSKESQKPITQSFEQTLSPSAKIKKPCQDDIVSQWRRGWDSNPRYHCWYTPLAGARFRPLSHLSVAEGLYEKI